MIRRNTDLRRRAKTRLPPSGGGEAAGGARRAWRPESPRKARHGGMITTGKNERDRPSGLIELPTHDSVWAEERRRYAAALLHQRDRKRQATAELAEERRR